MSVGDVTTGPGNNKRIIQGITETHTFGNLDKMDQFLKTHKVPQLTQYELNNLNSPINSKEIKFIIKTFQKELFSSR